LPKLFSHLDHSKPPNGANGSGTITGKREHIYHATMLNPHPVAVLDPDPIYALVDDLIEAHDDWLPHHN